MRQVAGRQTQIDRFGRHTNVDAQLNTLPAGVDAAADKSVVQRERSKRRGMVSASGLASFIIPDRYERTNDRLRRRGPDGMPVTYELWVVLLSIVIAIQGAYVGLSLAVQIGEAAGLRRRLLLAGAAFSLAVAIWAMHFVGMLAARLPFPVDYLVLPTLLSFLVCVIVVGAAVYATSSGPVTALRLVLSAALMGAGIFSMHYIGMAALHASAHMLHALPYVAASMAVAIGASGLALWLATGEGGRPPLILSASAFGVAVSGMHYTAMAGLTVLPHSAAPSSAPALSTDLLAIVVAVVAFCVSGMFLLFLVPDRTREQPQAAVSVTPIEAAATQAETGRGSYG